MKRVIAGCIDLTLEFDSVEEYDRYKAGIAEKHQTFRELEYMEVDEKVCVRIQRQYNNSPFPDTK